MGMVAILFSVVEPVVNIPSTEGPMWNLVKIGPTCFIGKYFKDYKILYMYVGQGQGRITFWDKFFIVTKSFYYFNNTL